MFVDITQALRTTGRLILPMQLNGILPDQNPGSWNNYHLPAFLLGQLNKSGVPSTATIIMGIIAMLYALSGQFNLLTDLSMFVVWSFYVLTFIGVILLRQKQPNLPRPYKVPLYPVIPIIAIAGGLFVVINQLLFAGMENTLISLGGIIVTLIGLPLYNLAQNQVKRDEEIR